MSDRGEFVARAVRDAAGVHDNPALAVTQIVSGMADRIEELEAENTRIKLALGQIQRRESPDAGKPWRFDEHAGYGENNRPLAPMEGKE